QRRADALGLWLEEQVQPGVQLVVHSFEGGGGVSAALAGGVPAGLVTEEGGRVSPETSLRLASDAEVVPIKRGADGSVLDVGRRLRTVDWRLRKALEARDGGCRFPGCGSRLRTHAHHIIPWAEGGETAMANLVLLCPLHHRAVHEGGWRVEADDRGVLRFLNPLGVEMPLAPAAPDVGSLLPDNGAAPPLAQDFGLAHWHGRTDVSPWTGSTVWHGERIDWDWALDWFCNQPDEGADRREGGDGPGGGRLDRA
ncbi:MAG: HNH endonuclease signature motif containing protein, partial [Gemmatimonadota bacterium]|nr:HNH endonuclease signature motif containing protein [Gemmatimonadota bacterium]